MRIDQVSAVLRPRSNEEAVDLGLALVRRHAPGIYRAWFTLLLPFWGLLLLTLHDSPSLMVFIAWWLKPLYDRVVIFYLGRALFGDAPSLREQIRAWPRLLTRELFPALLWRRFSPARSFILPVLLLENLRGKAGRQRAAILKRYGGPAATGMMSGIGLLEMAVLAGLAAGLKPFLPEEVLDPITSGSLLGNYKLVPLGLMWSLAACWLTAMALIEPFYAGAGFGLYLNSRTHLEGWDVEVAFRRLGDRLRLRHGGSLPDLKPPGLPVAVPPRNGPPPLPSNNTTSSPVPPPLPSQGQVLAAVTEAGQPNSPAENLPLPPAAVRPPPGLLRVLTLALGAWFCLGGSLHAVEVDLPEARRQIKEVMSDPDFIRHTEKYKVWEADPKTPPSPKPQEPETKGWDWSWLDLSWVKGLFQGNWPEIALRLFLLLLAVTVLGWAVWALFKNRARLRIRRPPPARSGPRVVMGMELRPETLPPDIPAEAWAAWSQGRSGAAVRLLYRGALAWLVERGALPIRESDTEGDCLRHAAGLEDSGRRNYFGTLTAVWRGIAYGNLLPDTEAMRNLCGQWPFSLSSSPATGESVSPPARGTSGTKARASLLPLLALLILPSLTLTGCGRLVEKERTVGYKGEALRDPWLAAERFLRLNGYTVDTMRGFVNLPHHGSLLIVPSDAITSEALANIALRWTRDGGHLIYLVYGGETRRDDWDESLFASSHADSGTMSQPMLTALGLSLQSLSGTPKAEKVEIEGETFKVSLGETVTLDTSKAKYPSDLVTGPADHASLVSLRCGHGRVTVLTNAHALRNRFIDDDDHAALLLAMAGLEPHISAVRFVKAGRLNLWTMLVEHAWMALIAVGVLLLIWLWRYLPRFGPVTPLSTRSQRRFATHLEEAGNFYWKHHMAGVLLEAPRQAVLSASRRLALKETDPHFLPTLAARSGLPPERIRDAMQGGEVRDARALIQQMADLQKILHSL